MGFRIFASGAEGFHYLKEDAPDLDGLNMATTLMQFYGADVKAQTAAVSALGYIPTPSAGLSDIVTTAGSMQLTGMISTSVTSLGMRNADPTRQITVSCQKKNTLWADSAGVGTYQFSPGNSLGAEFFRAIKPALEATDLGTIGVLAALCKVLGDFDNKLSDSGTARLFIQISH